MIPLLAALASGPAFAADVLVPEATPASMSDFAVAYMVYGFLVSALEDAGYEVDDGDEIREWAGGDADACGDVDECPGNLWDRTDARLAVVLVIGQADGVLSIESRIHSASQAAPIKVVREKVQGGGEVAWSKALAKTVVGMMAIVPERSPSKAVGDIGEKPDRDEEDREEEEDESLVSVPPKKRAPAITFDEDEERSSDSDSDDSDKEEDDESLLPKKSSREKAPTKPDIDAEKEAAKEAAREKAEKEEAAREKAEKAKADKERAAREKAEKEEAGREKAEKEEAAREKAEKAKADKEEAAREKAEKAKADKEEKAEKSEKSSSKSDPPRSATKVSEPKERDSGSASLAERFGDDPKAVEERKEMGIPWSAYAQYRDSGLSAEAWLKKAQVRSGHVFVGLGGGYALGDVDRGYGVRVGLDDAFATTGTSSWTGSGAGDGATARALVGYAPIWFLDTAVAFGIQSGRKYLNVGWECTACTEPTSETPYTPVDATQFTIEPRARLFPLATGVAKPYGLVGFNFSVYDGFHIPDESGTLDYPDVDGGAIFGPTAGLGVLIDPVNPFSIVVEVPMTFVLSDGGASRTDPVLGVEPTTLESNGWVIRAILGVEVKL